MRQGQILKAQELLEEGRWTRELVGAWRQSATAIHQLEARCSLEGLRIALEDLSLGDHGTRPIFIAHFLKTTVAAFDDWATLPNEPDRDLLLLAVVRFLASPIAERGVASATEDAIRFVRDGIPPQRLTP